jgi:hypothetical protein
MVKKIIITFINTIVNKLISKIKFLKCRKFSFSKKKKMIIKIIKLLIKVLKLN